MSRAYAGRPGMPPADRKDIRCINCGGTGHGWRACPNPELPAEKRPCLSCGKPGHFSRDCTSRPAAHLASTVEGGEVRPSHVTDTNGRVWALTCRAENPGDSSEQPRVRGRPYTKVIDEDGFEVVQGGFRPLPRGVSVGDFVRPATKPRQRAQHAHASAAKFFRNDPTPPTPATAESQEGSSPLTDDGKRAAHSTINTPSGQAAKAETQSTLAEAKSHEQLLEFAARELDRRQQRYEHLPRCGSFGPFGNFDSFDKNPEALQQHIHTQHTVQLQNTHTIQQQTVKQVVNAIEFPSLSSTTTTAQTKGIHKAIDIHRLTDSRIGEVGEDGDGGPGRQGDSQPLASDIPMPLVLCTGLPSGFDRSFSQFS